MRPFYAKYDIERGEKWKVIEREVEHMNSVNTSLPRFGNKLAITYSEKGAHPEKIILNLWSENGGNEMRTYTITSFESSELPEYEFTVSAFGLEEPFGITWERPTPWWIYFGLIGGGCLVGFVLIGVFLRRRYGAS